MLKQSTFKGLSQLRTYLNSLDANTKNSVFILFTGNKNESNGQSWCPDCIVADSVIQKNLHLLNNQNNQNEFITCFVGERDEWKNPANEFRLDKEFQLKRIPSLVLWKKNKSLVEDQCADESLVQMLFEEQ